MIPDLIRDWSSLARMRFKMGAHPPEKKTYHTLRSAEGSIRWRTKAQVRIEEAIPDLVRLFEAKSRKAKEAFVYAAEKRAQLHERLGENDLSVGTLRMIHQIAANSIAFIAQPVWTPESGDEQQAGVLYAAAGYNEYPGSDKALSAFRIPDDGVSHRVCSRVPFETHNAGVEQQANARSVNEV